MSKPNDNHLNKLRRNSLEDSALDSPGSRCVPKKKGRHSRIPLRADPNLEESALEFSYRTDADPLDDPPRHPVDPNLDATCGEVSSLSLTSDDLIDRSDISSSFASQSLNMTMVKEGSILSPASSSYSTAKERSTASIFSPDPANNVDLIALCEKLLRDVGERDAENSRLREQLEQLSVSPVLRPETPEPDMIAMCGRLLAENQELIDWKSKAEGIIADRDARLALLQEEKEVWQTRVALRDASYSDLKSFCQHELDLAQEEECSDCMDLRAQLDSLREKLAVSPSEQPAPTISLEDVNDLQGKLLECQQVLIVEKQKQNDLNQEKESLEIRLNECMENLQSAEQRAIVLAEEKDVLVREAAKAKRDANDFEFVFNEERAKCQKKMTEKQIEITQLEEAKSELEVRCTSLQLDLESAQAQIETYREKILGVEVDSSSMKQLQSELDAAHVKMKSLESQITENEQSRDTLTTEMEKLKNLLVLSQAEIDRLGHEAENVQKEMLREQADRMTKEKHLQEEIDNSKIQIDSLEKQCAHHRQNIDKLIEEKSEQSELLQTTNGELEKTISALESQRQSTIQLKKELDDFLAKTTATKQENRQQIDQMMSELSGVRNLLALSEIDLVDKSKQLKALEQEFSHQQQSRDDHFHAQETELKNQLEEAQNRIDVLANRIVEMTTRATEEMDKLTGELRDSQQEAQNRIDILESRIVEMTTRATEEMNKLTGELRDSQETVEEMKALMEAKEKQLMGQMEQSTETICSLQSSLANKEKYCQGLQTRIEHMERECDAADGKEEELNQRIQQLQERLAVNVEDKENLERNDLHAKCDREKRQLEGLIVELKEERKRMGDSSSGDRMTLLRNENIPVNNSITSSNIASPRTLRNENVPVNNSITSSNIASPRIRQLRHSSPASSKSNNSCRQQ